jgi:sugar lactone lactonase YvrE
VFHAGLPVFRKYGRDGRLLFERRMQGVETDSIIDRMPSAWPRRSGELAVVRSTVRAAAVDRRGNLWVSFADPYTYVFDPQGDKIRTVQFRGVDVIAPTGLFFTGEDRLLVTPGLFEFDP